MSLPILKQLRWLLIVDFTCALVVGALYLTLFNWMIEFLALPASVAKVQLCANFAYGFYGVLVFLSRDTGQRFFKFLICMNAVYALFCLIASSILFSEGFYKAGFLLLAEFAAVASLALLELRALRWNRRAKYEKLVNVSVYQKGT